METNRKCFKKEEEDSSSECCTDVDDAEHRAVSSGSRSPEKRVTTAPGPTQTHRVLTELSKGLRGVPEKKAAQLICFGACTTGKKKQIRSPCNLFVMANKTVPGLLYFGPSNDY